MTTAKRTPSHKPAHKHLRAPQNLSVLHLHAPNDESGNPRRLFVVIHPFDGIVLVVDEGYGGWHSLIAIAPELRDHATTRVEITPKEYRALKRGGK